MYKKKFASPNKAIITLRSLLCNNVERGRVFLSVLKVEMNSTFLANALIA